MPGKETLNQLLKIYFLTPDRKKLGFGLHSFLFIHLNWFSLHKKVKKKKH